MLLWATSCLEGPECRINQDCQPSHQCQAGWCSTSTASKPEATAQQETNTPKETQPKEPVVAKETPTALEKNNQEATIEKVVESSPEPTNLADAGVEVTPDTTTSDKVIPEDRPETLVESEPIPEPPAPDNQTFESGPQVGPYPIAVTELNNGKQQAAQIRQLMPFYYQGTGVYRLTSTHRCSDAPLFIMPLHEHLKKTMSYCDTTNPNHYQIKISEYHTAGAVPKVPFVAVLPAPLTNRGVLGALYHKQCNNGSCTLPLPSGPSKATTPKPGVYQIKDSACQSNFPLLATILGPTSKPGGSPTEVGYVTAEVAQPGECTFYTFDSNGKPTSTRDFAFWLPSPGNHTWAVIDDNAKILASNPPQTSQARWGSSYEEATTVLAHYAVAWRDWWQVFNKGALLATPNTSKPRSISIQFSRNEAEIYISPVQPLPRANSTEKTRSTFTVLFIP